MKRASMLFLTIALVSAGCAATPKPGMKKSLYEGLDEKTEQRLMVRFEEESRKLDRSGFLYEDKGLEEYLNRIARKVWPPRPAGPPITIKVIKNPELNAFAYPTGRIYIHTGILASMENEAQLAVLLGHEIIHVVNRHSAKEFTKKKIRSESKTTLNSWLGSFGEAFGSLAINLSVNGYSREFEAEADRQGLDRAVKAGYDPREAVKLHELFLKEIDAKKTKDSFLYSRHPAVQDRIESYRKLLKTDYKDRQGIVNADAYRQHTNTLLLDNAVLDLKLGNFDAAERTVEKYIKWKADDARAYFLLGEIARGGGRIDGEQKAMVHYQKAVSLRKNYADPYRAMGLMAYKKGDKQEARKNLEQYLLLQPDASDRDYIEQYINECR